MDKTKTFKDFNDISSDKLSKRVDALSIYMNIDRDLAVVELSFCEAEFKSKLIGNKFLIKEGGPVLLRKFITDYVECCLEGLFETNSIGDTARKITALAELQLKDNKHDA